MKLFITSRHHVREELQDSFFGAQITAIEGDLDDIKKHLIKRMEQMTVLSALKRKVTANILKVHDISKEI